MEGVKEEAIRAGREEDVIQNYMNEATKPYSDPVRLGQWARRMHGDMDGGGGLVAKDAFCTGFDQAMLKIITEIEKSS